MLANLKTNPMFIWSDIEIENQKKAPPDYLSKYTYIPISAGLFFLLCIVSSKNHKTFSLLLLEPFP